MAFQPGIDIKTALRISSLILKNPKDINSVRQLKALLQNSSPLSSTNIRQIILSTFYPIIKEVSQCRQSYSSDDKQAIIDTIEVVLSRIEVKEFNIFLNLYGFLLNEVYDPKQHLVLNQSEELKLSVVRCVKSLYKSISSDLLCKIYTVDNVQRISCIVYVLLDYINNEQMRKLQIESIECIMVVTRVYDDSTFNDPSVAYRVAEVVSFFFPALVTQLATKALADEKIGHLVPMTALDAWSKLVALVLHVGATLENHSNCESSTTDETDSHSSNHDKIITVEWCKTTDEKLHLILAKFLILSTHSHRNVRFELGQLASLLCNQCYRILPLSFPHLVEILFALSNDGDEIIAMQAFNSLEWLSMTDHGLDQSCNMVDSLKEGFYGRIDSLTTAFNRLDEKQQLVSLNVLNGYIKFFHQRSSLTMLLTTMQINHLLSGIMNIVQLDNVNINILEHGSKLDLDGNTLKCCKWKKFVYFRSNAIFSKIQSMCANLSKLGADEIICDYLFDVILNEPDSRNEATCILNEFITGLDSDNASSVFTNVIDTYLDIRNWDQSISLMPRINTDQLSSHTLRNNLIFACLLVEGIGNVALVMKGQFNAAVLFKTLYPVMERAGHSNPFVSSAGVSALHNISIACGFASVSDLLMDNIDYYSFHVKRKLNHLNNIDQVLNVFSAVMQHCPTHLLHSTFDIIEHLLKQFKLKENRLYINTYLQTFKIFLLSVNKVYSVETVEEPLKSKKEKLENIEHFKVSNLESSKDDKENTFDDDVKEEECADTEIPLNTEETIEDQQELNESNVYQKATPTTEIAVTVSIMKQILHVLASKDRNNKLLTADILLIGLNIIKDWEDELLPMVHAIWSPLVSRFTELNDPLIVNASFKLLLTLTRLSKTFIRHRTVNEVLPKIVFMLETFQKESLSKGTTNTAYTYNQSYKLQVLVLHNLSLVVAELDMNENSMMVAINCVYKYLNRNQPVDLRKAAIHFFQVLFKYDPDFMNTLLQKWRNNNKGKQDESLQLLLKHMSPVNVS